MNLNAHYFFCVRHEKDVRGYALSSRSGSRSTIKGWAVYVVCLDVVWNYSGRRVSRKRTRTTYSGSYASHGAKTPAFL